MINTKVLLKAMGFMLVPSITIMGIILIAFFNWANFVAFMTSSDGWSIFVRLIMVICEVCFTIMMYEHYLKIENMHLVNEQIKNEGYGPLLKTSNTNDYDVQRFFGLVAGSDGQVQLYKSPVSNTFICKTIKKKTT